MAEDPDDPLDAVRERVRMAEAAAAVCEAISLVRTPEEEREDAKDMLDRSLLQGMGSTIENESKTKMSWSTFHLRSDGLCHQGRDSFLISH